MLSFSYLAKPSNLCMARRVLVVRQHQTAAMLKTAYPKVASVTWSFPTPFPSNHKETIVLRQRLLSEVYKIQQSEPYFRLPFPMVNLFRANSFQLNQYLNGLDEWRREQEKEEVESDFEEEAA